VLKNSRWGDFFLMDYWIDIGNTRRRYPQLDQSITSHGLVFEVPIFLPFECNSFRLLSFVPFPNKTSISSGTQTQLSRLKQALSVPFLNSFIYSCLCNPLERNSQSQTTVPCFTDFLYSGTGPFLIQKQPLAILHASMELAKSIGRVPAKLRFPLAEAVPPAVVRSPGPATAQSVLGFANAFQP
jgi:hypothetical protein